MPIRKLIFAKISQKIHIFVTVRIYAMHSAAWHGPACKMCRKQARPCLQAASNGRILFATERTLFVDTVVWSFFCNMDVMRMTFF